MYTLWQHQSSKVFALNSSVISCAKVATSVTISMIFILRYIGNMYVYLPYTVTTQSTSVTLASSNIESYTKLKPVTQQGKH